MICIRPPHARPHECSKTVADWGRPRASLGHRLQRMWDNPGGLVMDALRRLWQLIRRRSKLKIIANRMVKINARNM